MIEHIHTLSEITDYSNNGNSNNDNSSGDICFLLMSDIISSYINTAIQNHTDLLVSNSILSSSTRVVYTNTNLGAITYF